jgi:hypothetical protein
MGGWGCEGLIVKAAAPELGDEMAGMQGGEQMAGHGRVCVGEWELVGKQTLLN